MKKLFVFGLAILAGQATAASDGSLLPDASSVVGVVNGKEVALGEIENVKIHELRMELYAELENAFIAEALKRLKESNKEVGRVTVPKLQEEDIRRFYVERDLARRGSYEHLAPQIRQLLEGQMRAKAEYDLYNMAVKKGLLSSRLLEPSPFKVTVPLETAFIQGEKNSPVILLEFVDFRCPACKVVQPVLQSVAKKYRGRVVFAYRNLPFQMGAYESALAVECAREQNKFLEMHDRLYERQSIQSIEDLRDVAKDAGVADLQKFNACLDENKYRKRIYRDMEVAQSIGINGTPAFVIGRYDSKRGVIEGELLQGSRSVEDFSESLDRYLTK